MIYNFTAEISSKFYLRNAKKMERKNRELISQFPVGKNLYFD